MHDPDTAQRLLAEALARAWEQSNPGSTASGLETHISRLLFLGNEVLKLKRPLDLGFLDYGTLERRRHFCLEEVRLNRRTAPALYLGVDAIEADSEGPRHRPLPEDGGKDDGPGDEKRDGPGEAPDGRAPAVPEPHPRTVEYAVRMRRFPGEDLLDARLRAGTARRTHLRGLGRVVAAFHRSLPPWAGPADVPRVLAALRRNVSENFEALGKVPLEPDAGRRLWGLRRWSMRTLDGLEAWVGARVRGGFFRECHGDLHCANVVLLEDTPTPFDCIEFSETLRRIDIIDEVAFLWTDLGSRGEQPLATAFLNAWLEETGDFGGLGGLRFHAVYRALVRAKVAGIALGLAAERPGAPSGGWWEGASRDPEAERTRLARYLAHAHALASTPPLPRLILTRGPSGSGKTTLAAVLAERLGAIHVRSDVERKRLLGLPPRARTASPPGGGAYEAETTERTYRRLLELARTILEAGFPVVVDATFLGPERRRPFLALARAGELEATILDVSADPAVLEARIRRRLDGGGDASEATPEVLRRQLESMPPLTPEEARITLRVDTSGGGTACPDPDGAPACRPDVDWLVAALA